MYVLNRGDSRIGMTIARDEYTAQLNRADRFIIDDPESPAPLAYRLTKPFKLGGVFNNQGVYRFVLQEVATEETDDLDTFTPNYYLHIDRDGNATTTKPGTTTDNTTGKRVYL